jgi:hypothetical protein
MARRLAAPLAALALVGCPHDFRLPVGWEAGADRPVSQPDASADIAADRRPRDTQPSPDKGCPSPCVTTYAGLGRVSGGADGPLLQARFSWPGSVEQHPSGMLVADEGNAVLRLIAGGQVTTFATQLVASDVAVRGTDVFVSGDCRLRKISAGQVSTVAGSESACGIVDGPLASALLYSPQGLVYHPTLSLLVADAWRVRQIGDTQVTTLTGSTPGYVDGSLSVARFRSLSGLAVDGSGTIYVADSFDSRIRRIANGIVDTFAGDGLFGFLNGPAATARFNTPMGLAIEASGALLVADSYNNKIRRIANGVVTTVAGSGADGYLDGPADVARFSGPSDILVDASGVIYVVDTGNHCIRRIE